MINARRAGVCNRLVITKEAAKKSQRGTPEELRALAQTYRGLAEVGAADNKSGRLRLAEHIWSGSPTRAKPRCKA